MLRLLINPESKSAYFHNVQHVTEQELKLVIGDAGLTYVSEGGLDFIDINVSHDRIPELLRLSFVQGVFELVEGLMKPLDQTPLWRVHEDFVFGSKFKGKTNERLTQLLLNAGLASIDNTKFETTKVLDPMAGRGTTLFWAIRYGLRAWGIEQDAKAYDDVRQIIKKWSKIHRQKHQLKDGFVGKPNRQNKGKFLDWQVENSAFRFVIGDSRDAATLMKEKFDLIISDLPYGVQHHTTEQTRNPLAVVEQSLPGWVDRLKKGGAIVLAFNANIPKRGAMVSALTGAGLEVLPFEAAHRMSESIVRDIVIAKKP